MNSHGVDPRDAVEVLTDLERSAGRLSYLEKGALRVLMDDAREGSPFPDGARHEVECPACGATIRARMADAVDVQGDDAETTEGES